MIATSKKVVRMTATGCIITGSDVITARLQSCAFSDNFCKVEGRSILSSRLCCYPSLETVQEGERDRAFSRFHTPNTQQAFINRCECANQKSHLAVSNGEDSTRPVGLEVVALNPRRTVSGE